jgi:hypothetical protein
VNLSVPVKTFSLDAALDDYTEKRTGPRDGDGYYHPSSIYQCDRKVIYDIRDTPREDAFRPGDNRPLLIGNILGPVLQQAIHEQVGTTLSYAVDEPLVEIPELNVRGHADAFVIHMDGTPELIENKTANSNSIRLIRKAGQAKPDHINQGLTYLYAIKYHGYQTPGEHDPDNYCCPNCNTPWSCNGPHIPEEPVPVQHPPVPELVRLAVNYLDKDRHWILTYHYELDDEWEDDLRAHIARLDRYKNDGTALPPRLAARPDDHWLCRSYCGYRERCYQVDTEGVGDP